MNKEVDSYVPDKKNAQNFFPLFIMASSIRVRGPQEAFVVSSLDNRGMQHLGKRIVDMGIDPKKKETHRRVLETLQLLVPNSGVDNQYLQVQFDGIVANSDASIAYEQNRWAAFQPTINGNGKH